MIWLDGWMDDLQFYILCNSISVISGQQADDNEMLCAMGPCLWLRRFRLKQSSNYGQLDQQAKVKLTELPGLRWLKMIQYIG